MSYARSLLETIAKEMGKSPESMNNLIDLLEQNMCDTQQALLSTSLEELVEIGIPKLVAMKIKKKLNESEHEDIKIMEEKFDQPQSIEQTPKINSYNFIDTQLRKIYDNYLTADEKLNSLEVLQKIIANLLSHPEEAKYRSLKKNNPRLQTTLWRYLFMEQLFIMLGFEFDSETNSLVIPENRINVGALIYLNDLIREDIEETKRKPKMDPYKPGFSSTNPDFNIVEVGQMSGYGNSKFTEQLDKLKEEREKLVKQHKISQKVKVYQRNGNSIPIDINKYIDEEEEEKDVKKFELSVFRKKVAEFQDKYMKDMQFSNARKKEFEEFLKQPLHLDTIIKIKLPNSYIIETNFASNQKLADVFNLLDKYLIKPEGYFLYIAPNVKNKYDKNDLITIDKRLCDLGMVPDAVLTLMYFDPLVNKSEILIKHQEPKA